MTEFFFVFLYKKKKIDATQYFETMQHSMKAWNLTKKYLIGKVKNQKLTDLFAQVPDESDESSEESVEEDEENESEKEVEKEKTSSRKRKKPDDDEPNEVGVVIEHKNKKQKLN